MKKLLILILITLLLTLSIFLVVQGVHIGNFEILGIKGIKEKNSELDDKIQQAAKLAEKDYKQVVSDVDANTKKLKNEKKNYEDMTAVAEGEEELITNQIEKYEIETLWVKIGNHATSEGVVMQMDVIKSSTYLEDTYNLKFTATGSYISITDFISAIENDSTLGFKIEEFKMNPSGSNLQATFVCRDISIKDISSATVNLATDETTGSTSNTVNTNSTTNTTNTNNTNQIANTTNTNVAK